MSDNTLKLQPLITQMEQSWTSFSCGGGEGSPNNRFLFGWSQEVDDVHNKGNIGETAFMVLNPPTSSASSVEMEYGQVKTTTSFVCQIYSQVPSTQFGLSPTTIPAHWDEMENCFYHFLDDVLLNIGSKLQLGGGSLNITRTKQASNDQLFQMECKWNMDYFRHCFVNLQ